MQSKHKKSRLRRTLVAFRWRIRKVSYGKENPDKTFYVIRRHSSRAGLFSFYTTNLGAIVEAVEKGYIPVIDMQNSINPMLTPELVGRENAWDYYFRQPSGYTLKDISHSKNVILGSIDPPEKYPDFDMISIKNAKGIKTMEGIKDCDAEEGLNSCDDCKDRDLTLEYWRKAAHQYILLLPDTENIINEQYDNLSKGRRMLGVLCRGTDYVQLRPHGHPVQPDAEVVINKCIEILNKFNCTGIYLATEDEDIWRKFSEKFGDRVCSYQKHRYTTKPGENVNDIANTKENPEIRNREYLISIGILSKCNCLVAGAAGGTYGALLMSEGFEYEYVYDLGKYE